MTPQFKNACARAGRQVQINYHTEALLTVAKAVPGADDLVVELRQLVADHEEVGELTIAIGVRRNILTRKLERLVTHEFGEAGLAYMNARF